MPRPALRATACLVGCALALSGASAAARAVTPGWKTYRVAAAGLAIALPVAFVPTDFGRASPQPGSPAASQNPGMSAAAAIAVKNKLVKFFAFALEGSALVDVAIVELSPVQRTKVSLGAELTSALIQAGISPHAIHETSVDLPVGKAKQLTVTVTVLGTPMRETEFTLLHRGSELEIGFVAPAAQAVQFASLFMRSMRSVRFLH